MALNTWWEHDPEQRYWMEITGRDDIGENLVAPQLDGGGNANWSYALVSQVRPGDRVLHYSTNSAAGAAIIGWSQAIGDVSEGVITWQARGTRGRERGFATTGPSWFVPLGGMHELAAPIRGKDLGLIDVELNELREKIEREHGRPAYFPFFRYRPGEVRAQQGYLVKFPKELFEILPGLGTVLSEANGDVEVLLVEDDQPRSHEVPRGKLTRIQDAELRAAIERRSLDVAIEHFRALGATDISELGKPYDLRLHLDGAERHVEVKGSSLSIGTVELTINEVMHATNFQPTDLVVVDEIAWKRTSAGAITTSGGRLRKWSDWIPSDDDLESRKFAYFLPAVSRSAVDL